MKVVINKCYGGFDLSPEALILLYKRGGKIEGIDPYKYYGGDKKKDWKKHFESDQETGFVIVQDDKILYDHYYNEENRNDPILVSVVEELGEKANGRFSNLKIIEIPDNVEYEIDNYDGIESIHEIHRNWG